MKCPKCLADAFDGARFCTKCGAALAVGGRPDAVLKGEAGAGTVTGGIVAGIRVEKVDAHEAVFESEHIEVRLSEGAEATLLKALAVRSEMPIGGHSDVDSGHSSEEIQTLKRTLDELVRKLDAAGLEHGGEARLMTGHGELDRTDLLLKKSVLLETEAEQTVARQLEPEIQRMRAESLTTGIPFVVDDAMLQRMIQALPSKTHIQPMMEALDLCRRVLQLDPTNTEALIHLARIVTFAGADPAERRAALQKVISLASSPKDDNERFHLAQATAVLSVEQPPYNIDGLRSARGMFERLGRSEWVAQIDLYIALATGMAGPGPGPGPGPMPVDFNPLGRWQVIDATGAAAIVDYMPGGTTQATVSTGMYAGAQFIGIWSYDPRMRFLQVQGMINGMMPYANAFTIQGRQGNTWTAVDATGMFGYMTRIA